MELLSNNNSIQHGNNNQNEIKRNTTSDSFIFSGLLDSLQQQWDGTTNFPILQDSNHFLQTPLTSATSGTSTSGSTASATPTSNFHIMFPDQQHHHLLNNHHQNNLHALHGFHHGGNNLLSNIGSVAPGGPTSSSSLTNSFIGNGCGVTIGGSTISNSIISGGGSSQNSKGSPSESSNHSSSIINCGWCDLQASKRCLDCNEFLCNECVNDHQQNNLSLNHMITSFPTPIGTSPTGQLYGNSTEFSVGSTSTHSSSNNSSSNNSSGSPQNYFCDLHTETLRYVCEHCKKLVCQCCTLREHKDHTYISIGAFTEEANEKIEAALESSSMGTKRIKGSIDTALAYIRFVERDCMELSDNVRKAFRQFIIAIEDRERYLLDMVQKMKQRRLSILHEQMAGLKSALSGLAETSEMLNNVSENRLFMNQKDLATKITNGQRQLEQFAAIYKDLQPKKTNLAFIPPDYNILQDIRSQGDVVLVDDKHFGVGGGGVVAAGGVGVGVGGVGVANNDPLNMYSFFQNGGGGAGVGGVGVGVGAGPVGGVSRVPGGRNDNNQLMGQQFSTINSGVASQGGVVGGGVVGGPVLSGGRGDINLPKEWNLAATLSGLHFGGNAVTKCIAGSPAHISVRNSNDLSVSFATEGHDDGKVSRPWGVCVDKNNNVIVSDRRNNRIQVFSAEGLFKFKFGKKGVGNGEFDLPAGICVDIDNRIIVVDKDNHRVQIFTSSGIFLLKFGKYGKEYGQFQYPWDVAVNSKRQIVVTDSRNNRIQQFDSEGRFIRQLVFDNSHLSKGIASPRGVCYTPQGNIIVSDFDNHCLYLIDSELNEILAAKGQEGSGLQEFNRPSGLCCDDDGRVIVADSKNQRVVVFSPNLDYLWDIEIRPSKNPIMPLTLDEKDRTCDVALMLDGRIVFLIELSPDSKEGYNPQKKFVHVF
ncbi:TRIM71 family protein [Megaselia abdita]